jgi:hypothetical protein
MFYLPWWVIAGAFIVQLWFITIPAIVALLFVGSSRSVLRQWRAVAFVVAALLVLPFLIYVRDVAREWGEKIGWIPSDIRTLDRDELVLGLALPAGTRVQFVDRSQNQISRLELPHSANIRGVDMVGELEWTPFTGDHWEGRLARDRILNGWPCRAGAVSLTMDWTVRECVLSEAHEALGLTWPAGTTIFRRDDEPRWGLDLPNDAGLTVPRFAMTVPPRARLFLSSEGRLDKVMWASNDQPMYVHDVPLSSLDRIAASDQAIGTLYSPFMVSGEMRTSGTKVCIDLSTGKVLLDGIGSQ